MSPERMTEAAIPAVGGDDDSGGAQFDAERLSLGVAGRLSRYLQVLIQARKMGKETISSQELAAYTHINSTQIRRDLSDLEEVVEAQDVVVGVLAVPSAAAQDVADRLVASGVKIIFNYSEQLLNVPPEVTVHTSSPAVDLLYALYFYLT